MAAFAPLVLLTRCTRTERPLAGEHLLALTGTRLIIFHVPTRRVYLNLPIQELSLVRWAADPGLASVQLAATMSNGVRERFTINVGRPELVRHLDEVFASVFPPSVTCGPYIPRTVC